MTKKTALLASLFAFSGSAFIFLASNPTDGALLSLPTSLLLVLTGTSTGFVLISLFYNSSFAGRPSVVQGSIAVTSYSTNVPNDVSALTRLLYAVDQHSIISKTDVAGRITYVNDLFEKVSGYQRNELIGQTHRVIKSDKHSPEFFTEMWQTISEGKIWQGEVCNQRKNGEFYWVESTIVPFVDDHGTPYEYISVRTDITKIKNYEEALLIAKNEAEEANKTKTRFLSNMSHELRTPLNAIMGFTQVLELNDSIDEEGKTYLNEISKAGRYLVSLFDDMLDMGCVENDSLSLSITKVCLHEVLDECMHLTSTMARVQGIDLTFNIGECQSVYILIDHKRLKQVVLNLLTNAIKYNSENGSITLQCNISEHEEILIEVVDTGEGLTDEEMQQIFKPFVRVGDKQDSIRGTGIGLALSKNIMQKMGGDVLVHSIKGQGSKFTIKIASETQLMELYV